MSWNLALQINKLASITRVSGNNILIYNTSNTLLALYATTGLYLGDASVGSGSSGGNNLILPSYGSVTWAGLTFTPPTILTGGGANIFTRAGVAYNQNWLGSEKGQTDFALNSAVTIGSAPTVNNLTKDSAIYQINTNSSTTSYRLPLVSGATPLGTFFIFNNNGGANATIANVSAVSLHTLAIGATAKAILIDNTTANGTWEITSELPNTVNWGTSGATFSGDLNATNLNGKLGIVGASTASGNVVLCNNTSNTSGNFDLQTDSDQHLTFSGGTGVGSNVLSVGGGTNGAITVPSTAGSVTANTFKSNASTKMTLNTTNGTFELQNNGAKTGDILYANATFPLQMVSTAGLSLDAGSNGNTHISSGQGSEGSIINLITGTVSRAQVTDNGILCNKYSNLGDNNLSITAFNSGTNPAILFNSRSSNSSTASGRWGYINNTGWNFEDGNSSSPTVISQITADTTGGSPILLITNTTTGNNHQGIRVNHAAAETQYGISILAAAGIGTGSTIYHIGFSYNGSQQAAISQLGGTVFYGQPSDLRYKENLDYDFNATELLDKIKPVQFNFKTDPNVKQYGFIAQDVLPLLPQYVTQGLDGFYQMDYSHFTGIMCKATKEQQTKITSLEAKITSLEAQLASLKATVDALVAQKEILVV
jgi:hypothetical protein